RPLAAFRIAHDMDVGRGIADARDAVDWQRDVVGADRDLALLVAADDEPRTLQTGDAERGETLEQDATFAASDMDLGLLDAADDPGLQADRRVDHELVMVIGEGDGGGLQ